MNFKDFLFQYSIDEKVHSEEVKGQSFIVGRSSHCNIKIDFEIISRKHMQVFFEDDSIKIKDLGSTNGTFINGTKLKPHTKFEYEPGDELFIEGAGLRCDFEIKSLLEERSKSFSSVQVLENSEISFHESEEIESESEDIQSHDESLVNSGEEKSIVDIPSRWKEGGNDSISVFHQKQDEELSESDESMGEVISSSQILEDQVDFDGNLEVSDLKKLPVKGKKNVQERKSDIKILKDRILQEQKELDEGEVKDQQHSEEEISQLLEEEGGVHLINEIKQQELQEFRDEVLSPPVQSASGELKENKDENSENEIKKISERELEKIREEYRKSLDEELNHLRITTRLEAKEEAAFIIEKAKKEVEDRVRKAEEKADNGVKEAERIAQEIIRQAQEQTECNFEAVQREIEERKKKANTEIENLYFEIEEERGRLEKEFERVRKQAWGEVDLKFKDMRCELEVEMDRRVTKRLREIEKEAFKKMREVEADADKRMKEDKVSNVIDKSVNVVVLEKIDDGFVEDEHDMNFDLYQKKVKKFWLLPGLSFVIVVMLFVFLPTFRESALQTGRNIAAQDVRETRKKTVEVKEKSNFTKEFNPDKVDKFLKTYTDRVLYTRDYVAVELFKDYREKWILELQNYFTKTLKLSENHRDPFIIQESNLIRELDEAMKKINGHFVDEEIARMREIEKDFEKKLQVQIGRKGNYEKVMAFKKAFFQKNANKFRKKISSSK